MIAKLENGYPRRCPQSGKDSEGRLHTNLPVFYEHHPDEAAKAGFYPVRHTEKPDGNYLATYELQENDTITEIVPVWTEYTPEPEPLVVDSEKLRSDVDYIAMMFDLDLDGDSE